MYRTTLAAAALAISTAAAPALAQNVNPSVNAGNLVNVNISNVANDLAENLSVDVSQIPVTVQVPVGIAANVCGVDANVLAQQKKDGDAACDATSDAGALTSQGFTQIVERNLLDAS